MIKRLVAALVLLVVLVLSQSIGAAYPQAYRFDRAWGTQGSGNGQFASPIGVCVDGTRLHVAESGNHRMQTFSLTGTYLRTTPAGTLNYPWGVAVGPDHSVYVAEVGSNQIHKFSPTLADLGYAGASGSNPDQFNWPQGIAWDPIHARVAVTDRFNARLSFWTEALSFISAVTPTGDRALSDPASIAFDSAGNYYIADTSHHRIEMYNSGGTYTGSLTAGFSYPYAVAVCPDNTVVVADYFNCRIVKMSTTGTVLAVYGSYGTGGPNSFQFPGGVAADASGRLYVADTDNHRIVRLRPDARPTVPTTIAIRPKLPVDSNNITATASGSVDADGDPITYRYQWYYKNALSDPWTASAYRKRTLPASATSSPQWWKVQTRAFDGDVFSGWKDSATIYIRPDALPAVSASATSTSTGAAITVSLPAAANVQVTVLNLAGRTIAALAPAQLEAGVSTLTWNGRTTTATLAPRGQYLIRVTASTESGSASSATTSFSR